jgi:hypothetical protein
MQDSLETLAMEMGLLVAAVLSATRRVTIRVTRWHDGDMRKHSWRVAGLLQRESKFAVSISTLLKALESLVRELLTGREQCVV